MSANKHSDTAQRGFFRKLIESGGARLGGRKRIIELEAANKRLIKQTRKQHGVRIRRVGTNTRREISSVVSSAMGRLTGDPSRTVGVFGQVMHFSDIKNLVRRDSIAYRIWAMSTDNPFNKWNVTHSSERLFIEMLNKKLETLKWRATFNTAWGWAVKYGYSVILKLYDDETFASDLSVPVQDGAQITRVNPISPDIVKELNLVTEVEAENYLTLESVDVKLGMREVNVHASRVFLVTNPSPDGDMRGMSVFEPVWDDFTFKKNQDISIAATVVQNIRKLPVFHFTDLDEPTRDTIDVKLQDIRSMDSALLIDGGGPDFKIQEILGAGSLNPEPYTQYNLQNISAGVGIPMHVLLDMPAGALVASNENVKNYLSKISNDQTKILEPIHVALIQELINRNQIPNANFSVEWLPLEEMTFAERSQSIMRDGLGFLNYSKGLREYVGEDGIGIGFAPNDWEIQPNEWGGFSIGMKPETEPEKSYQTDAQVKAPKVAGVLTAAEFVGVLSDITTLQTIYGPLFALKHYTDIVTRLTWLAEQNGLLGNERAIRQTDIDVFFANVLNDEREFIKYMNEIDALKAGGVSTFQLRGSCPECEKLGVYNVYRTNSTTIPLVPMHGKDCTFEIGPY